MNANREHPCLCVLYRGGSEMDRRECTNWVPSDVPFCGECEDRHPSLPREWVDTLPLGVRA